MSWKKFAGSLTGLALAPFTGGLSLAVGAGYDYLNSQKQAVAKQNQLNQQSVDRANAYSKYTWDLQNEYNSPVQQMARLKSAGLNPNLVYGSGSVTGNSASAIENAGVATQQAFNSADTLTKTLPILQGFANLRNTNTQNDLLNYQMGQTQAQTDYTRAQIAQTRAETQNLNNYLTGKGKSTYDPATVKTVDAVKDTVSGIANSIDQGVNFIQSEQARKKADKATLKKYTDYQYYDRRKNLKNFFVR